MNIDLPDIDLRHQLEDIAASAQAAIEALDDEREGAVRVNVRAAWLWASEAYDLVNNW